MVRLSIYILGPCGNFHLSRHGCMGKESLRSLAVWAWSMVTKPNPPKPKTTNRCQTDILSPEKPYSRWWIPDGVMERDATAQVILRFPESRSHVGSGASLLQHVGSGASLLQGPMQTSELQGLQRKLISRRREPHAVGDPSPPNPPKRTKGCCIRGPPCSGGSPQPRMN